ncbi:glycosyltransferase family 2 protein [Candidatus Woesebacteria bacterium]|nr:glycosyltransferase family 2 protein [Candidatus Woesebacteria bacterium]MCD8507106.1 glycosyltransferase family 2 protein [Candidatus Woesebacteria bacterium]MCD8526923.1 glycosyltransferase family 2 protein [Candidatus Woesebacteria bacterium]MCD8546072.1 glycosyltransferase family 2 protein [Candidatus Woesebacteria bacterium]
MPDMPESTNRQIPRVTVVVVSYNTAALTQKCLDAVLKSTGVNLEILVADNCSTDRTLNQLRRKYGLRASKKRWQTWQETLHNADVIDTFPSVKVDVTAVSTVYAGEEAGHEIVLFPSDRNLGFGRANNLAAAGSAAEYVFFLNSDAFVQPSTIKNLVKQFRRRPSKSTSVLARMQSRLDNVGIIAAELRNEDKSLQRQGGSLPTNWNVFLWATFLDDIPGLDRLPAYQHHLHDMRRLHRRPLAKVGWVGGTAMMISRSCIDEIGGFDSEIFMYGEDVDLCWRATLRHWDVALSSKAKVTHLGSASAGHKASIHGEISGLLYMWQKHRSPLDEWILRRILTIGLILRTIIFGILRRYGQQRTYQEALELVRQ